MDRDTTVARKRVEDSERAITQEQKDMRNAIKAGLTTTSPDIIFEEMLNTIRDSLHHLASSNDKEDGYDKDN